ncbi:MAG: hypothetical protein MPN21_24320 [Thermoanaerobaculia bacterium]|nr:hypothetical protein [Thermoanaerobaculia bacterium]
MSQAPPSSEISLPSESWLALVPTLGHSRHLADSVAALRREGGQVLVIAPRGALTDRDFSDDPGVDIVETDGPLGFAAANLVGLAAAPRTEYLALVNDDAVVETGWAAALLAELEAHPRTAAAQGLVVTMQDEPTVDGAGLAWNHWWQAVQVGRGDPVDTWIAEPDIVFGVSATAAMYRRAALDEIGPLFETRLDSYYEDVDLALRLRAAGWSARRVAGARARHAGSTTGRHLGADHLVRRNRYSVLARALGPALLPRLPKAVLRDAIDTARACLRLDLMGAGAIAAGTISGLLRLPAALGPAMMPPNELQRWMEGHSGCRSEL